MYHWFVRRKVVATFDALSAGHWSTLVEQLAPDFEYRFVGNHALGGTRRSASAMTEWGERAGRLFPRLQFSVRDVVVAGPPWDTTVLTYVTVHEDDYRNEFFQRAKIRWGRLTDITTLEDLDVLHERLDHLAGSGIAEAHAPPITG